MSQKSRRVKFVSILKYFKRFQIVVFGTKMATHRFLKRKGAMTSSPVRILGRVLAVRAGSDIDQIFLTSFLHPYGFFFFFYSFFLLLLPLFCHFHFCFLLVLSLSGRLHILSVFVFIYLYFSNNSFYLYRSTLFTLVL